MLKQITEWLQGAPPRSSQWPAFRKAFLKKNKSCAACGTTSKLEVHHILPYHEFPGMELQEMNCITLCGTGGGCHITFGHLQNWKSWNVHVRQDAEEYLKKVQNRPMSKD